MGRPKGSKNNVSHKKKPKHGKISKSNTEVRPMTAHMLAVVNRARDGSGKFLPVTKSKKRAKSTDDANDKNRVKRKYTKRKNLTTSAAVAELLKYKLNQERASDDVSIDSDDDTTVYLFPEDLKKPNIRLSPLKGAGKMRPPPPRKAQKSSTADLAKGLSSGRDTKAAVNELLNLDCGAINSKSAALEGLMGPPPSTPFTSLRNSVSRPVARIPISPYTRSPMSVSSHHSVTDRSSQLSVDTPHSSPSARRVTRSSPNKPPHQRLPSPGSRPTSPALSHASTIQDSHAALHGMSAYHSAINSHMTYGSSSYSKPEPSRSSREFLTPGIPGYRMRSVSPAVSERRLSVRQTECAYKYKHILVKKTNTFTQVIINAASSRQKNILTVQALNELASVLNNAKYDDNSQLVLITGCDNGTFCSGLDLIYLTSGDIHQAAKTMSTAISEFVRALLTFPKPVVAAVNGQAVGFGVGILPLCDIVYASDKAMLHTPYTQLGQVPEAGLSCTLSQIIGSALANEMLMAGRVLTALEAYQMGLVAQVFWPTSLMSEVVPRITNMANCSSRVLNATKSLIRSQNNDRLLAACLTEASMLAEIWPTSECQRNMRGYLDHCDTL